jgi:hypothetical protein
MAEPAARAGLSGLWPIVKKRWRAWLRAFHRDFGYLAIGFTVIYAVSGIAQNHIEDWGDVSYKTYESTRMIEAIADDAPDAVAIAKVAGLVDLGKPTATFRAGDEVRLDYANGSKVTAIGEQVTIQRRERRAFIGAANWLHTARSKKGWKYVSDAYAVLLLYLAISGIFMIKGKLGLKGRGALLISAGVAVPIAAVLLSSPEAKKRSAPQVEVASPPAASPPTASGGSGITFLPTDDDADSSDEDAGSAAPKPCDPFGAIHGCKEEQARPSNGCDPFGDMHGCKKEPAAKPAPAGSDSGSGIRWLPPDEDE